MVSHHTRNVRLGKQYNSKDELWNAVKNAANNVSKKSHKFG